MKLGKMFVLKCFERISLMNKGRLWIMNPLPLALNVMICEYVDV